MTKTALLIDHDDSFIWNIKFWLEPEFNVSILNHTQLRDSEMLPKYDLVILSPGPKSPQDYPSSLQILNTSVPVLGICLGMQMMILADGGKVRTYAPPVHGKTSIMSPQQLVVARYHSLRCEPTDHFKILGQTTDDQSVMWVQHKNKNQMGFQFHPESFLTENSHFYKKFVMDWIKTCQRH